MIYYLATADHRYTMQEFQRLEPSLADAVEVVSYEDAVNGLPAAPGTYIFSDLERLSTEGLHAARALWQRLSEAGPQLTMLNNPSRALRRYELLRTLHDHGINDYTVHRLSDVVASDQLTPGARPPASRTKAVAAPRYPVYIRENNEHTKNLTELLHSWEEVRDEAERLLTNPRHYLSRDGDPATRWHRIEDLIVVEWCDTSDSEGVFWKYGAFVVGNEIVPRALMCARQWVVSDFELLDDEHLAAARRYLAENPHAEFLRETAARAGIEYGRFDYAFLNGRPQVWEININPGVLHAPAEGIIDPVLHQGPARRVAHALRALDSRPVGRRLGSAGGNGAPTALGAVERQTVCLCMIVRNEAAIIERCLRSVIGLIDSWVICDTGSSDDTREVIRSVLEELPGELYDVPWVDFSHNRTDLMARARGRADYLLLIDADMTVRQGAPLDPLDADAYLLREAGALDFGVIRLVRGDRRWWYEGSTHEYIATDGQFSEIESGELFVEHHADGAARPEKLIRDAGLLKRDLARDPKNARAVFYLAQTYRDLGEIGVAIEYYRRRAAMGGWSEEVFYAKLQEGTLRAEQDVDAAVPLLLDAWQRRPTRAEPLHELARLYRNRGEFAVAHLFAARGLEIPYPTDILFVHRWVYEWGLLLERAIAAAGIGRLDEAIADLRGLERRSDELPAHIAAYVKERLTDLGQWPGGPALRQTSGDPLRLASLAPSARIGAIRLEVEPNWPAFNPSITSDGDGYRMIVRTANYVIEQGVLHDDGVLRNLNYMLRLDAQLGVTSVDPIVDRALGPPRYDSYIEGYEDCRLIAVGSGWHATATACDMSPEGLVRVALLSFEGNDVTRVQALQGPAPGRHEKNWMPFVVGDTLHLLYCCHPTIVLRCDPLSGATEEVARHDGPALAAGFRGGSQGLAVPGGYMFVVHEVDRSASELRYLHRFVLLDETFQLSALSPRFTFTSDRVEFCAGIARHDDGFVLSFGVSDAAAGLAVVPQKEVFAQLESVADVVRQSTKVAASPHGPPGHRL